MDELQGLLTKAAEALCAGHAKDAYFGYLDILDAAATELRKIKFITNVAITSPSTASLLTMARKSVTSAQEILAKNDATIAATIPEPKMSSPSFRKASLSRHTIRLNSGQARSVTMLTKQLQAAAAAMNGGMTTNISSSASLTTSSTATATSTAPVTSIATAEPLHRHRLPTIPEPLASSIRQAGVSSLKPASTSPVIYSPLLRSTSNGSIPPKPTRRPPPSPPSDMSFMEINESSEIDAELHALHSIQGSPPDPSPLADSPRGSPDIPRGSLDISRESLDIPSGSLDFPIRSLDNDNDNDNHNHNNDDDDDDSLPLVRPPLPPKPAHLNRKITELNNTGDLYLDDDDSDDDGSESDVVQGSDPVSGHQALLRKSSSPSIAIPNPKRRPGSSVSVPVSPTHSPTNIPSSSPSSHDNNRSFSQYSLMRQSSVGTLMTVIPEGCVDPMNLVEAERINKEDEDQLGQKTYGPSDHIPMIPLSPLRTTHRSLVEKEKSWSAMLAETKHKLQTLTAHLRDYSQDSTLTEEQLLLRQEDDEMTHEILQEDLHKCNMQISNVMSTVTKVRELLYRSASTASILEFQPHLIAYQLTLVESAIFLEIPSSAFLTHSPKTPHRSITASTDFFNYLTRMIEYSILFPPDASGRAQSMNHWIKVAVKLHELENFQTLKAVLCALGTPPIKRLKRTWSFLPRKSANKLETLSELMSEARNYGRYREMMNSLCAGTIVSSSSTNGVTSPAFSDSSSISTSSISGSRFDILGSWTSSDLKAKEAARRPMVPFIGTFIMDMTYLLAAVKKSSFQGPSPSAQVSATSSLRETSTPANNNNTHTPQFCPEDDPRIQDLLLTLSAYQAGPKYSAQPPKAYIKASLKGQNHFRAPSLSSALQMTTKYRNSSNNDRDRQSFDDEDEDLSGGGCDGQNSFGGGVRSTQQLILHYLLTRPWVPERMVDELSTIREPSKVNKNPPSSPTSSTTSSATSSGVSSGGWSSASSLYSQSTATSSSFSGMDLLKSRGSFEGSRPTSVEEE
ncbi:hypothetical protein EC957_006803 [Mortierella hygrophila]|uniref:Ras-GEF domain-containing protein n=1 Tax=Mortierella hygrophila TaxID=979708 RepID=A0A9P6K5R4_9FUNG|nr:hypothetical protein EC957_006803 [Mortierella hygrophila]